MIKLAVFKRNVNIIMQVTIFCHLELEILFPNINEGVLHYVKRYCCLVVVAVPLDPFLAQLFTCSMKQIALTSSQGLVLLGFFPYAILFSQLLINASPRNSPRQSTIAEGFAEPNSTFIAIKSAKVLPRWLFLSKIYIQFTIFNTYFSTKLSFTNKRYHLHVLGKCLNFLQEVRSIIYFRQFIHPTSLMF